MREHLNFRTILTVLAFLFFSGMIIKSVAERIPGDKKVLISPAEYEAHGLRENSVVIQGWTLRYLDQTTGEVVSLYVGELKVDTSYAWNGKYHVVYVSFERDS